MNSHSLTNPLGEILTALRVHRGRWVPPAVIVFVLAGIYAVCRPNTWEASQSFIVRNEATGNLDGPGKFRHTAEMKAAQETILELAKSRTVLSAALKKVGPPADRIDSAWPTAKDVAALADSIKLSPPKGAEFGTTEVLYLKLRDSDRARALDLVSAVWEQLQGAVQQLRDVKARSMIDELNTAAQLAERDLSAATSRLAKIEREVGSDLAELRSLHDTASGDSHLRRKASELETELRQARLAERNNLDLVQVLSSAQLDQGRLLATPNRLLESQPALRRLKDGLVDAQLRTAQLLGGMSAQHPLAIAAKDAEEEVKGHVHGELASALEGAKIDSKLSTDRVELLASQLQETRNRLERLAGLRAEYSNLVAMVQNRMKLEEEAQRELAEARGSLAGAHANLISSIDTPDTGISPLGPGRALILLTGLVGGVLVGGGILFLSIQPQRQAQPASAIQFQPAVWNFAGLDRRRNRQTTDSAVAYR